jgi:hypothetical protein
MIVGEPFFTLGKHGEVKLRPSKSCTLMASFVELANSKHSERFRAISSGRNHARAVL